MAMSRRCQGRRTDGKVVRLEVALQGVDHQDDGVVAVVEEECGCEVCDLMVVDVITSTCPLVPAYLFREQVGI